MNSKEIQDLAKRYFSDNDNVHDYRAFSYDRDGEILSKVVFSWSKSQGYSEIESNLLSSYVLELACQNYLV